MKSNWQQRAEAEIGSTFMADDAFGVEVAKALGEGYDTAIFVDAVPKGDTPGTLFVIEPELRHDSADTVMNAHGLDPVRVLALARQVGDVPERVLVVGCEPAVRITGEEEEIVGELSEPVRAAVPVAVELVENLVQELTEGDDR